MTANMIIANVMDKVLAVDFKLLRIAKETLEQML
jgi:hypothetical protein